MTDLVAPAEPLDVLDLTILAAVSLGSYSISISLFSRLGIASTLVTSGRGLSTLSEVLARFEEALSEVTSNPLAAKIDQDLVAAIPVVPSRIALPAVAGSVLPEDHLRPPCD